MKRLIYLLPLLFVLAGCAGHASPKVVISSADRAAYEALRTFQTAEEGAWHANAPWPSPEQHKTINGKVSETYQLIIDVANIGIALPPGGKLTVADLALVAKLSTVVADIVALAKGTPVETQAATVQTKTAALVTKTTGGQ